MQIVKYVYVCFLKIAASTQEIEFVFVNVLVRKLSSTATCKNLLSMQCMQVCHLSMPGILELFLTAAE